MHGNPGGMEPPAAPHVAQLAGTDLSALLQTASRLARLGGWAVDLLTGSMTWSDEVRAIHEVDAQFCPSFDRALSFYTAESQVKIRAAIGRCASLGEPWDLELELETARGNRRRVRIAGEGRRNEGGAVFRIEGALQDITPLKGIIAESQAPQLTEKAALLNQASDAIFIRSAEGLIQSWNPGAERLYGWSAAEAIGRSARELLGSKPDDFASAGQVLLERGEWAGELNQTTKTGGVVVVRSRWTLVRQADGTHSVLVINSDITKQKAMEQQLFRAQRLDSIGTLAAGIAHDMNNVLAPVLMGATLLRSDLPEGDRDKLINTMEASAQRGAALVRKLLIFGRGMEGERRAVDVSAALSDVAGLARQTFPRHINVTTRIAPDLPAVVADPIQLEQVLLNLAVNARDAMPKSGELALEADAVEIRASDAAFQGEATPGKYVRVAVRDTGSGIPPEIRQRIFDPFFTTKAAGQGTGLGLSCVLGIVKGHLGFIRVNSEVGRGTEFAVYLPAADRSASNPPWASEPLVSVRGNGEMILVVDDEESVRAVLRQILLRCNYEVVSAENGVEAVAVFAATPGVKLIVADVDMPLMDGVTLARVLRRMNPAAKLLICTGAGQRMDGDGAGIAIIRKPFSAAAFAATVALILRQG